MRLYDIYSEMNPADSGTKMVKVQRLKQSLWAHGPWFLVAHMEDFRIWNEFGCEIHVQSN